MDAKDCIPKSVSFKVIRELPHLDDSYTQGLQFLDGKLYESTGRTGQCKIFEIDAQTGKISFKFEDPKMKSYFCEGLTYNKAEDNWVQLTWKAQKANIYRKNQKKDKNTPPFILDKQIDYQGQGWGITYCHEKLYMTNGSSSLLVRNPKTFKVEKEIKVTDSGRSQSQLNELECVDRLIYANVYTSNEIVIIDPFSGMIKGKIKLNPSELLGKSVAKKLKSWDQVLNGIAYDSKKSELYITGKDWPKIFVLKVQL